MFQEVLGGTFQKPGETFPFSGETFPFSGGTFPFVNKPLGPVIDAPGRRLFLLPALLLLLLPLPDLLLEHLRLPLELLDAVAEGLILAPLLLAGADPLVRNDQGKTALDVATDRGHTRVVEMLQRANAP